MLIDLAPKEPTVNAPRATRDTYLKWLNDCTTVHYIIRVPMNDEFSCKFEDAQLEEMIQLLNESFDIYEDVERHKIFCVVFNARM